MKEFMYAMALCLVMMGLWCVAKAPSDAKIAAMQRTDANQALEMAADQHELRVIAVSALGLGLILGVVGWRSKQREDPTRKQLD